MAGVKRNAAGGIVVLPVAVDQPGRDAEIGSLFEWALNERSHWGESQP